MNPFVPRNLLKILMAPQLRGVPYVSELMHPVRNRGRVTFSLTCGVRQKTNLTFILGDFQSVRRPISNGVNGVIHTNPLTT